MANPGPIALRAVSDAEANLGVHEDGDSNSGQYVDQYLESVGLTPGNPWCMAFAYFRLQDAAKDLGLNLPAGMPRTGSTVLMSNWAKQKSLWTPMSAHRAQRGDLVFFYIPSKRRIGHVGFVTALQPWGVETVEGNTSDTHDVDANGGGVYAKHRTWAQIGAQGGFMRIPG